MALEAIQVLGSVDDKVRSGGITFEVKKIQTVQRFKDDLPSLEEVLLCDFKDLPVLVFSIAGKTRGGKSFLLNLMIKYLESLENKNPFVGEDWLTGKVPNCFTWKNGIESVTRGLWICPKIFRLKDAFDNQVGVLLLDAEGMYDGEATDGEIIAISGISAAISYLQIFNMKEKITSDYLEAVVRNLIRGIEEMDSEETKDLREEYKLMFVVRDWIGEDDFPFGLEGGKDYIDKESQRGTKENKQLWEVINNTFSDSKCVLLPDPGRQITKRQFNETGDLGLLDEEFLLEVRRFVEDLFRDDKLIPPSTTLTGQHIYKILKSIDGKIADEDLSFLNIFTENGNSSKVDKWISRFEEILEDVEFSGLPSVKDEMFEILRKAERTLRGKSRTTFLAELTEAIEGAFNQKVIEIIWKQYTCSFHKDAGIEKQQTAIWPDVNRKLKKHLCGNNERRQNANLIFIKKSAAYYYNLLQKQHKRQFENKCTTKATLEDLAGLDEKEIKSFKECDDFTCDENAKEAAYALWLKEFQCLKHGYLNIMLEQVSKITGILFGSLKKLRNKQYDHFENFTLLNREWDEIDVQDELLIAKKVGYALFGLPGHLQTVLSQSTDISQTSSGASTSTSTSAVSSVRTATSAFAAISTFIKSNRNDENKKTGYSSVQESKIWPIVKRIISLSKRKVKFSCIFLNYFLDNVIVSIPLLKIKTGSDINYIDSNNREYLGWDDFVINNTLSEVVYCYPLKGCYSKSEGFGIAFSKTPASKTVTKVLKVTDKVGKGVTFGAGVAAVAVACGVAAPILVPVTVVAGGASGIYGVFRGVQKMMDKNKHREPIKGKDIFNVAANTFAVVGAAGMAFGRLATFATEGVVILGSKVAAGLASVSSVTAIFTDSNNTAELISLIAQVEENSLKILFYFNATSLKDALEAIRKSLELENKSTFLTLVALLENNCIQFATGSGIEEIRVEKYVSQSTTTLVTGLLTAISSDIKDIVVCHSAIINVIQLFVNGEIRKEYMAETLKGRTRELFVKLEDEIRVCRDRFVKALCLSSLPDDYSFEQSFSHKLFENELVMALRYLIWSLISAIRKANNFFNNIAHKTITLNCHHLDDVSCHPLYEISQKIKEMVEQQESAINLANVNSDELDYFILQVLKMLKQNSNESWSVDQFVSYLTKITEAVVVRLEKVVSQHKELVPERENLTCNDLDELFKELGLEGHNYGTWLLKMVLNKITVDVNAIDAMNEQQVSNLILPAWSGILDDFYCYYSKLPVGNNKLELVQQIENIREDNYIVFDLQDYNFSVIVPSDASLCGEGLSAFVVQSVTVNRGEHGFIWRYKKDNK